MLPEAYNLATILDCVVPPLLNTSVLLLCVTVPATWSKWC